MCNNDKRENNIKEALDEQALKFFLDGYIDETDDDVVVVPRSEYDKLVANSTLMKVVERMINSAESSNYSIGTYLKEILAVNKPENPSATDTDEEDAE